MASRAKKPCLDGPNGIPETPDASDSEHSNLNGQEENEEDSESEDLGDSDSDVENDDGESVQEELPTQEMQVEFEARAPQEKDFHGLVRLLVNMFRHHSTAHNVDMSALADQIIAQRTVGSVIIQGANVDDDSEDEEVQLQPGNEDMLSVDNEIFGVVTVLGLDRQGPPHIKAIIDMVTKLVTDTKIDLNVNQLATLLGNKENKIGLIFFERFMNLPPQLAVPSYETLFNEVKKAKAKKLPGFEFTHFMLLSKSMVATSGPDVAQGPIYHNPEEEVMLDKACITLDLGGSSSNGKGSGNDGSGQVQGIVDGKSYLRRSRALVFRQEKCEDLLETIRAAFPF